MQKDTKINIMGKEIIGSYPSEYKEHILIPDKLTLENIKLREQVYELQEYIKDLEKADTKQKENIISLNETIDVLNSIVDSEKLVKKASKADYNVFTHPKKDVA